MTRASLLQILNHVGSISEAEVRELEQLAAAFPYCQTAHVLLAKAAHDRGSMLASQRLRRAATYAADRQLLRQLLEQPAPPLLAGSTLKELAAPAEARPPATALAVSSSTAFLEALVAEDVQPLSDQEVGPVAAEEETAIIGVSAPEPANLPAPAEAELQPAAAASSEPEPATTEQVVLGLENTASLQEIEELIASDAAEQAPDPLLASFAEIELAASSTEDAMPLESATEANPDPVPSELDAVAAASSTEQDELPAALAPAIRPPAEAGTARFEFGLREPEALPVPILYQLPGLDEEDQLVAEADGEVEVGLPAAAPALAPPFRADTDLAYALLAGGSRFGYALQLRHEELTQPLPATEFFPPDALLHAHSSTPQPASNPVPSPFDLINRFLKVQPRLKSPGPLPAVEQQQDLAARSSFAPPALASESLAKILIRQGKTDRAIEIYEQLMVRQPEKRAYFADQIQHLKTPE